MLGAIAGLVVAFCGMRSIVSLLPPDFPRLTEIVPDLRVLWFTGLVTLATTCLFGFAPAWRSAHRDVAPLLNDASGDSSETPKGRRLRSALVVIEMLLAFVLLVGAALCLSTLWRLQNVAPGFNPHDLVTARLALADQTSPDAAMQTASFYQELLSRIRRLPRIQSASACFALPLSGPTGVTDVEIIGRPIPKADLPRAKANAISTDYFRTMQIAVTKGREFDDRDSRTAPGVAIVNETLARTFFGSDDPIGKRIRPGIADAAGPPLERLIVGVVADIKSDNLGADEIATVYLPHTQCAQPEMTLVVRSAQPSQTLFSDLRDTIDGMEKGSPLYQARQMEDYVFTSMAQPRLNSIVLVAFAALAVALTAIGVYGVMAYTVAQRRHEIGIRLAVGAPSRAVFGLVMGEGVRLTGISLTGGFVCTWVLMRIVHPRYVLGSSDGWILILASALLSLVALSACCIPARRAVRLDPLSALGRR
jgi:putative ABC transport system permease protein